MLAFQDYEKFVEEFWIYYPGEHEGLPELEYVKLAIFGECGEIAEKIKKYYRGDSQFVLDEVALTQEVGDLLYYLVKFWHLAMGQITIDWVLATRTWGFTKPSLGESALKLCAAVGPLVTENPSKALITLRKLEEFANSFGSSLTLAAEANVEKLNSRRKRGKMRGSGDNR